MAPLAFAFRKLAALNLNVIAYWQMSNGVEFWMAVPTEPDILDDRFTSNIEFPFTFAEVVRVGLLSHFPNTECQCDIDQVFAQLSGIELLVVEREYDAPVGGMPPVNVLWLAGG